MSIMHAHTRHRFAATLAAGVRVLAVGSLLASAAGAAGAQEADSVVITGDEGIATVIERFDVSPADQAAALDEARATLAGWQDDPSFVGAILLRSREDVGGVAVYSQWLRQPGETQAVTPEASRSLRDELDDYPAIDSEYFSIAFTAQDPGLEPLSRASLAETPLAHFGLFRIDPANYDELIRRASEFGPQTFSAMDGIRNINFHRGASAHFVVNLGLWDSFDHFAALQSVPGFAQNNQYYLDLAEFRADFFDVVDVVPSDG